LPWDHLDSRVSKRFLQEERAKAFQETPTPDCRRASCNGCGVCFGESMLSNRQIEESEFLRGAPSALPKAPTPPFLSFRYRSQFTKIGPAKFLGHLELSRAITRAFHRTKIPLQFSQGFHPLPKISFGPPIPVGTESFAEFLDFCTAVPLPPEEIQARMNAHLPEGIRVVKTREIPLKSSSIFDSIIKILYIIRFPDSVTPDKEIVSRFRQMDSFFVFWPRKNKNINLKDSIDSISLIRDQALKVVVLAKKEGTLKPEEALGFIFGWPEDKHLPLTIRKVRMKLQDPLCPMKS
jgi:radical SAM-linked protein